MSATNRGAQRQADDFYATPAWATCAIVKALRPTTGAHVVDPACGTGAILEVTRETSLISTGFELDEGRAQIARSKGLAAKQRDVLTDEKWGPFDLVVMNPPFALAMQFVKRALEEARTYGADVVALLRLPWLTSRNRAPFHRAHPSDVFVLPRRPSFTPDGKTDATDYAWFVWGPARGGRWSVLEIEGGAS